MTWLWRTCFSLAALAPAFGASVSGTIRLADSRDPDVSRHKDYSGVVVWLDPVRTPVDGAGAPSRTVRMEQKGKRFLPHVLAISVGTAVYFPNLDPIFHSAFSNFSGQTFDLGLYAPGSSRTILFKRPGVVRVFCNIHPAMSAVIVVLRYPWFAVSNGAGAFSIPGVPPGEYQLRVFHERATQQTLAALSRKLVVAPEGVAAPEDVRLPAIVVSETGYVETPHKNKYGRDYPPTVDDGGLYPTGRK